MAGRFALCVEDMVLRNRGGIGEDWVREFRLIASGCANEVVSGGRIIPWGGSI